MILLASILSLAILLLFLVRSCLAMSSSYWRRYASYPSLLFFDISMVMIKWASSTQSTGTSFSIALDLIIILYICSFIVTTHLFGTLMASDMSLSTYQRLSLSSSTIFKLENDFPDILKRFLSFKLSLARLQFNFGNRATFRFLNSIDWMLNS